MNKFWSRWPGLNRRPTVYETVALPLSYIGEFGGRQDDIRLERGQGRTSCAQLIRQNKSLSDLT